MIATAKKRIQGLVAAAEAAEEESKSRRRRESLGGSGGGGGDGESRTAKERVKSVRLARTIAAAWKETE